MNNKPIAIGPSDVGRHVFVEVTDLLPSGPFKWLESPNYVIDSEAVIVLDEASGRLGYVYLRESRKGEGEFSRDTKVVFIDAGENYYETQEEAVREELASERKWSEAILRACEQWEKWLVESKAVGGTDE